MLRPSMRAASCSPDERSEIRGLPIHSRGLPIDHRGRPGCRADKSRTHPGYMLNEKFWKDTQRWCVYGGDRNFFLFPVIFPVLGKTVERAGHPPQPGEG